MRGLDKTRSVLVVVIFLPKISFRMARTLSNPAAVLEYPQEPCSPNRICTPHHRDKLPGPGLLKKTPVIPADEPSVKKEDDENNDPAHTEAQLRPGFYSAKDRKTYFKAGVQKNRQGRPNSRGQSRAGTPRRNLRHERSVRVTWSRPLTY